MAESPKHRRGLLPLLGIDADHVIDPVGCPPFWDLSAEKLSSPVPSFAVLAPPAEPA